MSRAGNDSRIASGLGDGKRNRKPMVQLLLIDRLAIFPVPIVGFCSKKSRGLFVRSAPPSTSPAPTAPILPEQSSSTAVKRVRSIQPKTSRTEAANCPARHNGQIRMVPYRCRILRRRSEPGRNHASGPFLKPRLPADARNGQEALRPFGGNPSVFAPCGSDLGGNYGISTADTAAPTYRDPDGPR